MLARARAGCVVGVEARAVDVEVHLANGLPGFEIVGLPETAVRESRVRVRAAILNSGFELPPRRAVLNLAPADLKKRGASLDLAIAVALLGACGRCAPNRLEETFLFGELSLTGELRSARGLIPQLVCARERGLRSAIVPRAQLEEASLVDGIDCRGAGDLAGAVAHLGGELELPVASGDGPQVATHASADLADVQGQDTAKRALEIAAAGNHHLLMVGPPGAGKTMLARRLPGILPRPSREEALSLVAIASAAGLGVGRIVRRPFRAPHHTASTAALTGGGDPIRPGEVTLAHGGVLFLDELPEFARPAIESFRTIMERGEVIVSRAKGRERMPAGALVVAAMNPCPCGFDEDPTRLCRCTPARIERYRARVSGPILDRFDLHVHLPKVELRSLHGGTPGESSQLVRARVELARGRLESEGLRSDRSVGELLDSLPGESRELMIDAAEAMGLSMRGVARATRVAVTIAALDDRPSVRPDHVAEALSYRIFDRGEPGRSPARRASN
ncbi:MAG: YifB family Mg chelatase-like AAA ATPase [Sandaracinaceae bacterium]|nr:YifB family Mg chelatase-like AAA ATPase [Sandaracinaceae bacterium]